MADRLQLVTFRVRAYSRALALEGSDAARFERVAGPILKREVEIAAKAAFGADLKPWNSNPGPRATFGYDLEPAAHGVTIMLKLRGGAWPFGEHGALPHLIGAGKGRAAKSTSRVLKAKGRRPVYLRGDAYGHPVLGPIIHPGTKGVGAIRYAYKRVRQAQRDAVAAGISAVLESVGA